MPHIVVTVIEGIGIEQKRALAEGIAEAVSESVGLPLALVKGEVCFVDMPVENCAPALDYGLTNSPLAVRYVSMNILKGRPLEQKRAIARNITRCVAEILGVPADSEEIVVEINEVNPENIAHGGVLTVDMEDPPLPV